MVFEAPFTDHLSTARLPVAVTSEFPGAAPGRELRQVRPNSGLVQRAAPGPSALVVGGVSARAAAGHLVAMAQRHAGAVEELARLVGVGTAAWLSATSSLPAESPTIDASRPLIVAGPSRSPRPPGHR